ncbi:hypothetical protein C8F04DRAFT_1408176 [Mycena alexandri]|uniref:Phosphatase activator n=1 Tax=Mycena alexandri TaxID=1745969 RepID=A0AAD6RWC5_9AGAR|nr:hypothetical protein C8F04DRAFT_1408176 [Mycena alexandri]
MPRPLTQTCSPSCSPALFLDLRGRRFEVDRETIMNLPESVLLCLFPNGLVLSRQSVALSDGGDDEDEEVYGVDFDPDCFQYVLTFFRTASEAFYGTATHPGAAHLPAAPARCTRLPGGNSPNADFSPTPAQNPPPSGDAVTDANGIANEGLLARNVNKENNVAEQHLIDMLCMSGFDRDDEWGFRALEPSRSCISSIALVLLKTGINHSAGNTKPVEVDYAQMATAQKLLLFWRKPARKCWWDGIEVDIPEKDGRPARAFKLWARRVWTLELSLV